MEPGSIIAIVAVAISVITAFWTYQRDRRVEKTSCEEQIARLETRVAYLEQQLGIKDQEISVLRDENVHLMRKLTLKEGWK